MSKTKKYTLPEAVEAIVKIAGTLDEVKDSLWAIGLELDKLNTQISETLTEIKEKGIITRAR